eukprot:UN28385
MNPPKRQRSSFGRMRAGGVVKNNPFMVDDKKKRDPTDGSEDSYETQKEQERKRKRLPEAHHSPKKPKTMSNYNNHISWPNHGTPSSTGS